MDMARNYVVRRFLPSTIALAMLATVALRVDGRGQPREADMPVVAIVSRSGLMLPLATFSSGSWNNLPWPQHLLGDPIKEFPLPVRRTLADVPSAWFKPLPSLPTAWRFQPINGSQRAVEIGVPARWDGDLIESVGLTVRPWDDHGNDTEDAGIAVSGRVDPLPVRRLHETSQEWQAIVRQLAGAFALAERRGERPYTVPASVAANPALARQLAKAEVSLNVVTASDRLSYYYLETLLIRPTTRASKALNCDATYAKHVGLLERRSGGPFRVKWLRGGAVCGVHSDGMEVIGAVRAGNQIRLVVRESGDGGPEYDIIDPEAPESKIRRGPWAP
jgi:hypothetical protein